MRDEKWEMSKFIWI